MAAILENKRDHIFRRYVFVSIAVWLNFFFFFVPSMLDVHFCSNDEVRSTPQGLRRSPELLLEVLPVGPGGLAELVM